MWQRFLNKKPLAFVADWDVRFLLGATLFGFAIWSLKYTFIVGTWISVVALRGAHAEGIASASDWDPFIVLAGGVVLAPVLSLFAAGLLLQILRLDR
jgi:hypothetical protein